MSRQELADAVNVHLFEHAGRGFFLDASYIGRLERGQHRWPAAHYRAALCAVLGAGRDADLGFSITRESPGEDGTTGSPFAARLKELRQRCGYSYRRLARLVHYSHGYLWDLENAEKQPTAAVAAALDRILGADGALVALVADLTARALSADRVGAAGGPERAAVDGRLALPSSRVPVAARPAAVQVHVSAGAEVTVVCHDGVPGRVAVLAGTVRVLIDMSDTGPANDGPAVIDAPVVAGGARVYSLAQRRVG